MFSAFRTFGRMGAPAGRTLAQQIAAMSPSLWLEPSVTSGYQDSAGTTALTQPGGGSADPPVGKAMDLSGNGNHAIQATSTARPKLSARRNLLTYTEDFSNAAWVKGGSASAITPTTLSFPAVDDFVFQAPSDTPAGVAQYSAQLKLSGAGTVTINIFDAGKSQQTQITLTATPTVSTIQYTSHSTTVAGGVYLQIIRTASDTATNVNVDFSQLELGSTATAYQRVTDANTYDYTGWPLIHQFDGVDDVLNVTFPSSLGSDCTVVTANRGTTPTILTGQTIGTSYTINTTNAGRLVFPRALTASETAIVTKWATQKGALP